MVKVGGISLRGNGRDHGSFCLLEQPEEGCKLYLKIFPVRDDRSSGNIESNLIKVLKKNVVKVLACDYPQTAPPCATCRKSCLGEEFCKDEKIKDARAIIASLLEDDRKKIEKDPAKYEVDRNHDNELYVKKIIDYPTDDHIFSKSFKRRLKRGVSPYLNRPIDLFIWMNYYDHLLEVFGQSYSSYSNFSYTSIVRMDYLKRSFFKDQKMLESNVYLILLELLKNKVLLVRDIKTFMDISSSVVGRSLIISKIEKKFNIFIYEQDMELLVTSVRSFDSFLLALAALMKMDEKLYLLPSWADDSYLFIPKFD